jgi:hypothetical protein
MLNIGKHFGKNPHEETLKKIAKSGKIKIKYLHYHKSIFSQEINIKKKKVEFSICLLQWPDCCGLQTLENFEYKGSLKKSSEEYKQLILQFMEIVVMLLDTPIRLYDVTRKETLLTKNGGTLLQLPEEVASICTELLEEKNFKQQEIKTLFLNVAVKPNKNITSIYA